VLSLLIHFGFATGMLFYTPPATKSDRIEVQFVESQPQVQAATKKLENPKQIVEQDDKALNKEIDEKAKYLSAHDQKVVKQTVTKNNGEFQNRESKSNIAGKGGKPKLSVADLMPKFDVSKAVHDHEDKEKQFENDPDAIKVAEKHKKREVASPSTQPESSEDPGEQVSQTVDYIKDLDPGLETLLSTREFVFYTYYARIRRQLGQFWGPKVKEKLIAIYKQGRQLASTEDKITRCLITLDKTGTLVKVQIIGNSGVRELDDAAVEAFRSAAPFPNPPKGIVEEDGNIHIRWDFILEV
jgi:TonB family protein